MAFLRSVAIAAVLGLCAAALAQAAPITTFGTVSLSQNGANVNVDVDLASGVVFAETAGGGGALFLFNDSVDGSTITNMVATLNGVTVSVPGGLSGFTNTPTLVAGFGTFTAFVECTDPTSCILGSGLTIDDLHFTVTNATIAQLTTANANGSIFYAATDPPLASPVPEPATLSLCFLGLAGAGVRRWRQRKGA